ncbi:hypothetical protein LX64_03910 [Chitinophaga skermanii]|uniref:Uncharacterized protein n=1 Tax=Chitinophaga skermanii TaxID=331697 RepID=A0A327QDI2_9BACT|nr:DUF5606 domain-containing protein [Chitinophaga skermanii]RAJ01692.1 hypothetical protein LX64_03910 [Chitinophaga skermanii]
MQYREIVAVTGLGGLFQLIASKQDGAIVRSLEDKNTRFVSSRIHNFTPLESIEVFTTGDNVNLASVFKSMQDQEANFPLVDAKADNNAIKSYFKNVFPEFDEERVYVSDMKKMVKWYAILKSNELLNFEEIFAEETAEVAEEAAPATVEAAPVEEAKPKKATKAKKEVAATDDAEAATEEKPKKTRAKKATAAEGEGAEDAAPKPKATRKKKTTEE